MDFQLLNATKLANTPDVTGRTWHKTVERDTATDTITIDTAGEIDAEWVNAGMPQDGLRIVSHRISGNRSRTFLTIPGDDDSPCYERINGNFQHVDGPTLADWQAQQEAAEASREARELSAWASGR